MKELIVNDNVSMRADKGDHERLTVRHLDVVEGNERGGMGLGIYLAALS